MLYSTLLTIQIQNQMLKYEYRWYKDHTTNREIKIIYIYSATSLVRPKLEELIPEKNSLEKIPKPLKRWMGRPQLLPEIVENVLRSLWWGNGSKQPSPCLQPPKVGGLLRHLLLLLKAPLTSLHFWSQIYMDFSQLWFRFSMNIFQWN